MPLAISNWSWISRVALAIDHQLGQMKGGAYFHFTVQKDASYVPLRPGWGSLCGGASPERLDDLVRHYQRKGWNVSWDGDGTTFWVRFRKPKTRYDWLTEESGTEVERRPPEPEPG